MQLGVDSCRLPSRAASGRLRRRSRIPAVRRLVPRYVAGASRLRPIRPRILTAAAWRAEAHPGSTRVDAGNSDADGRCSLLPYAVGTEIASRLQPTAAISVSSGVRNTRSVGCSASASKAPPPTRPPASLSKPQAYSSAIAEVNEYLTAWRENGAQAAAQLYKVQAERGPDSLRLSSGEVVSYRPDRWVSEDDFTLLVILELHFIGSPYAWDPGRNGRFITFTRKAGQAKYLMYFATSP